jgi:diguanylate cyclase (GGDEF)-like protein/PAS domain S-box-containing protein
MPFIDMSDYNLRARAYWWLTTSLGAWALWSSLAGLANLSAAGLLKLIATIVVVFIISYFSIRVPGTQVLISPGDIFVFLAALFGGLPCAMMVALTDSFVVSYRASRRWTSRLGGPALTAISIFASAKIFQQLLSLFSEWGLTETATLLTSLLIFSFTFFFLNSFLLTMLHALKQRVWPFKLWWANYSWTGLTFAASASAAGLIYLASKQYGIIPLLASAPIVVTIFATCHFYFKQADERARADRERVEAAEAQARQAGLHAQELTASEERFRSAFNYAAIGMALVAPDGKWLQVNSALCKILGYSENELLATNFQILTHADDLESVSRHIAQLFIDQVSINPIEKRYIHKLGHTVWASLSASLVRDSKTNSSRFIFQIQDITDRKRAEEKLAHDAFHDALTNLPNRTLFIDHLKMAMARSERRKGYRYAVLFLDFDRFKVVNDSLGHLVGDKLLVAIARRLESCLRPADTIARLGGDEFTILLEDLKGSGEAIAFAERLQKSLAFPFKIDEHEIFISLSTGIALSNSEYQKPEEILRDADTAMYHAKSSGKARYAVFDREMHTRAMKRLQLETDLRHAVEREEFFVVYQPIVSLETAQLVGFEALVRWQHPERGLISPAEFIPLAEETGHILPIGQWVLERACWQMREWQRQATQKLPLALSVNLSGKQLAQENITELVKQILRRSGVDPRQIKLEITESVVMESIETATETLNQLRALGIQLSIDDFGTGYSSLSYLHRLPVDALKIDRSFVIQMTKNNENAEIVRTIVSLAKTLGMSVIAEGVETLEQLDHLQKLECANGQGYLFAKPLNVEEAHALVKQLTTWRAFDAFREMPYHKDILNPTVNKYTM